MSESGLTWEERYPKSYTYKPDDKVMKVLEKINRALGGKTVKTCYNCKHLKLVSEIEIGYCRITKQGESYYKEPCKDFEQETGK